MQWYAPISGHPSSGKMMPSASLFSKILSHLSAQLRFAAKLLKTLKETRKSIILPLL